MVHYQIDEHAHPSLLTAMRELDKIAQGAVARIDSIVVRDIVAVIFQGRGVKRQQPDGRYPKVSQIIQLCRQSWKITDTVAIAVQESTHVDFINDRIFIPNRVVD